MLPAAGRTGRGRMLVLLWLGEVLREDADDEGVEAGSCPSACDEGGRTSAWSGGVGSGRDGDGWGRRDPEASGVGEAIVACCAVGGLIGMVGSGREVFRFSCDAWGAFVAGGEPSVLMLD